VVGSSRKTSSGSFTSASAIESRCCCPPKGSSNRPLPARRDRRVDEFLCGHGVIEEAAEEVQQFGHGQPRIERDALQLHTDPLLDRLRVLADIETEDLDGARVRRPEALQTSIVVVLPAPFGPSMPNTSPSPPRR